MRTLGLCIGASTISLVLLDNNATNQIKILDTKTTPHEGNPHGAILRLVDRDLLQSVDRIAVTGRKLRKKLNVSSLSEPEAVEYAYRYLRNSGQEADVIVSAGGETFMAYKLDGAGRVVDVFTGNKCASGTGEFFLQQIKRMDLSVEEAVSIPDLENPYKVAGRCSVFCKSDCTHALNKGAPKERVTAGLCEMMALKVTELLKKTEHERVMVVGGASSNTAMIHFLRKDIPRLYIPEHARCFEALGAALWALEVTTKPIHDPEELFSGSEGSFSRLPAIRDFLPKVTFKEAIRQRARAGDACIVGLDVGSTTTKAVVMRTADHAILAGCYLRTNGDPVKASRDCYREVYRQLAAPVRITGLGVTGSGRQIAGLHALTPAVINEIIAHATAAVYFDPNVDTIFEIGGQDAKYTLITNGVASDYAMNEACSAGTGSFLEEAARESLDIDTGEIGGVALKSERPLNFSDQCAAFISSDIKSAIQEGAAIEDLAAGLVYSICMNYNNRVKGNRTVGQKVFMQGGVCYNRAVPVAMAALTGKEIIVPPEPGLMGAFGVALEVKNKLALGLLQLMEFDLQELAEREVTYANPFTCNGGREKCDRKCTISMIRIKEKVYPFGGACNKYVNLIRDRKSPDAGKLDLVSLREKLVFEKYSLERGRRLLPPNGKTVSINRSLLVNTLFPLYYNFFYALGFEVVLSKEIDAAGMERRGAEFCYPVEIAHGALAASINAGPDIVFLPHVGSMPVENGIDNRVTCPFVQAEPYYLKAAFEELTNKIVLCPVLKFDKGYRQELDAFVAVGRQLGIPAKFSREAFILAAQAQEDFHHECRETGRSFLAELEQRPGETAVVLFGRPYNAFTRKANMGIPQKFATRGYQVIPHDFLPFGGEEPFEDMFWALGQTILKGARFVKRHPQLFAAYITNFSCGPDSFIVTFFRNIMGQKPSLTLELDSHSADAGLDTRVEAFLDVVGSYIKINRHKPAADATEFRPAAVVMEGERTVVVDSHGNRYPLTHPRVHVVIPSMGDLGSKLMAATLRRLGVRATAAAAPASGESKTGKGYASCKECLPLILTVGSLINYIHSRENEEEILVYFMPTSNGPCRFGQYNILIKSLIEKLRLKDVTQITLTCDNSYAGLGTNFSARAFQAVIISDVLDDIYSAVLTIARDKKKALAVFDKVCEQIIESVEKDSWKGVKETLRRAARALSAIERAQSMEETPKAALVGEIYVRRDAFSRQYLVERLAQQGIILKAAPITEWIYYCDYMVKTNKSGNVSKKELIGSYIEGFFKNSFERTIKGIFARSGFYEAHLVDVDKIIKNAAGLVSPSLTVETILTVGTAITEIVEEVAGVISIGPFGCMPSRIAEAIIGARMDEHKPEIATDKNLVARVMEQYPTLPFLAVETDGNAFPQVIEARLEIFCLQVERLHSRIMEVRGLQTVN
ncbi:R-phenyllactate dehydratase activator [Pelotomaculum sp. FP]|uniref:acyl-CoA dehydratase activase n=1 Tax=Pelotomaculum sp. FP TaxID=261474 RepID=UPI001066247A|nr:acyl-CoA dehydratase activase [Pelotomaculum sp. FP]TEB16069.1 R-phenyllactate dehydratase activator [Pelotomaculum sp. FP]